MKPTVFIIPFLFFFNEVSAQTCDCVDEFDFLRRYMETNHPGLNSNGSKKDSVYRKTTEEILYRINRIKPKEECILYLQEYFDLLNDHHISINPKMPQIKNFTTQSELDSFFLTDSYRQALKVLTDSATLKRSLEDKKADEIEGIYQDFNNRLVAVIRDSSDGWSYKGIIISPVKMYTTGIVKYMFQPTRSDRYKVRVLLPDFQKVYTTISFENGKLPDLGLTKMNITKSPDFGIHNLFEFRSLSDATNYLRISSFSGSLQSRLDSFYISIDQQIKNRPNLIIDVRNNQGGSETNYYHLLRYLYTGPIYTDNFQVFVTPDNIQRYKEFLSMMKSNGSKFSSRLISIYENTIKKMESAKPYTFIFTVKGNPRLNGKYQVHPKKIIILSNRRCASACEVFVYNASQSKKVEVMGENTGGFMGFGNVLPAKTPCYGYTFNSTTTKYLKLHRFEFTGIPPKIRVSENEDWIQAAKQRLEAR